LCKHHYLFSPQTDTLHIIDEDLKLMIKISMTDTMIPKCILPVKISNFFWFFFICFPGSYFMYYILKFQCCVVDIWYSYSIKWKIIIYSIFSHYFFFHFLLMMQKRIAATADSVSNNVVFILPLSILCCFEKIKIKFPTFSDWKKKKTYNKIITSQIEDIDIKEMLMKE
jgi:hypothetical protein